MKFSKKWLKANCFAVLSVHVSCQRNKELFSIGKPVFSLIPPFSGNYEWALTSMRIHSYL